MSIEDMKIGAIVEPKDERNPLCCGSGVYQDAIVVSMNPFVLVSRGADMKWSATVEESEYKVTGTATQEQLEKCQRRLS